ncbi:IncW-like replication protein (plasmid) [Acidisarcina polymorpha]|uniref:IncW-like replication protein n=2 Tax=Acidisarcina polymorpha TaxID=2211140 RepID=A0A2Z5GBL0_9BACT|nr:IncW-like replication protein [Acidisarcina polymorpha]
MARHIKRQDSLFPEMATKLDKRLALRQDILDFPSQDIGSMGHIARLLAQFGLPHSNPGEGITSYKRENGDLTIRINSLVEDGGVPWGILPRLILAYVSSQAVLKKTKTIHLGTNLSTFLRDELGMAVTGGKNGTVTRMKEQAYRLFTSSITIIRKGKDTVGTTTGTRRMVGMMNIADTIDMWEPQTGKNPDEIWQSTIVLDDRFYQATVRAAVPIDWRIVNGIQNSPLALDLYFWLTYRMKTNDKKTPIRFFGENSIYEQLGCGYANTRSGRYAFKKKTLTQLEEIKFYWPSLHVHASDDGEYLNLFPSPTSVSSSS